MRLIEDPVEAHQVRLQVERRRQEMYEELRRIKGGRSRGVNAKIREFRRGSTDLWDFYYLADIILDDRTYLEEVLCYEDSALGFVTDDRDGFLSFINSSQTRGRQVLKCLRWTWLHRIPVLGRRWRHRWARQNGAVPLRPY